MSPADFDACVANNGKVRTIKLSNNKYRHVCTLKGKKFFGHIKIKKKKGR